MSELKEGGSRRGLESLSSQERERVYNFLLNYFANIVKTGDASFFIPRLQLLGRLMKVMGKSEDDLDEATIRRPLQNLEEGAVWDLFIESIDQNDHTVSDDSLLEAANIPREREIGAISLRPPDATERFEGDVNRHILNSSVERIIEIITGTGAPATQQERTALADSIMRVSEATKTNLDQALSELPLIHARSVASFVRENSTKTGGRGTVRVDPIIFEAEQNAARAAQQNSTDKPSEQTPQAKDQEEIPFDYGETSLKAAWRGFKNLLRIGKRKNK